MESTTQALRLTGEARKAINSSLTKYKSVQIRKKPCGREKLKESRQTDKGQGALRGDKNR